MNPFVLVVRRPITTLALVAGLASGGVYALEQKGVVDVPTINQSKVDVVLGYIGMGSEPEEPKEEKAREEHHKIVVSSPRPQDVVLTQEYVCQIHSQRHINVCALDGGYLEEIAVKEGQTVKKGDLLFRIKPVLYKAKLDAELAEAKLAQLEYNYSKKLAEGDLPAISKNEVFLLEAKLLRAKAKAELAAAEMNFTRVEAPFDGIIDRLHEQLGSLIKEGDVLTTLSDNSTMWVYFNVPEKRYLEYMADLDEHKADQQIELVLADGQKFPFSGKIGAIEAKFNNVTGNIPFRADFKNPKRLLRHGQTGTVRLRRVAKDAIVIPQRATFDILDKRYVYVVDKDDVVHQREITVADGGELDDIYIIEKGVGVKDKIVLEGMREIRDGEKVAYEYREPDVVIAHLKNRAE